MNQDRDQDRGPTLVNLFGPSFTVVGLGLSAAGVFFPEHRTGLMMLGLLLVAAGLLLFFLAACSLQSVPPLDAPSLGVRWLGAVVTLLGCWFIVGWLFSLSANLTEALRQGEDDSSSVLLALKWGAFVILGPLLLSVVTEGVLARLWAFWRRGFEKFLPCCLAVLPGFILYQATAWMRHSGVVEQGSQGETGLILLAWGGNIVLMPFWVMFLYRLLAGSRLADRLAWLWKPEARARDLEERAGT